ncbi:MAG: hypothetical protein ACHQT9_00475 [Candidatus Saccharimonadales bacterium]
MTRERSSSPAELDHGPGFLDGARTLLGTAEPLYGNTYSLKPGDPAHLAFLTFFNEELKNLPLDGQVGESIEMRSDARQVLQRLTGFLDAQLQGLADGRPWGQEAASGLQDIVESGHGNELFKNIISPGHNISGMGYSVDLGSSYAGEKPLFNNVRIKRYHITNTEAGFQGEENGTIELTIHSGGLTVELEDGSFPGFRN